MLRELARACEDASNDDDVRVVVLTGAGRAFCVGATSAPGRTRATSGTSASTGSGSARWTRGVTAMRKIGKPTVARINGICVGGGNELQMACDLAVMVDDAFIRHVGLQHGSVPAGRRDAVAAAPRRRPPRPRDHPALRGDPGRAGASSGASSTAPSRLPSSTRPSTSFVAKLADRLPLMTRYAKAQLDFFRDLAWHGTIRHAHDWLALSMLSERGREAVQAFLDRRKEKE